MNFAPHTAPVAPALSDMVEAQKRLARWLQPTPLVLIETDLPDRKIFLKLEMLTPIGAFKIRPALNALLSRDAAQLQRGVATVSSGNMAYGMAWAARALNVPMAAYMYPNAPRSKIEGVQRLGGEVRFIDPETWWRYITNMEKPQADELFINPVTDPAVLAGNGTIGLELAQQLPDMDHVFVPIGGGSLATGVASALQLHCPKAGILVVEGDHATPATTALETGKICIVPTRPSFVKSIGGPSVVPDLWPVTKGLIAGSAVVSAQDIVDAMHQLFAKAKVVTEGAGAAAFAAALKDPRATGNNVCILSGGNVDIAEFEHVLHHRVPPANI